MSSPNNTLAWVCVINIMLSFLISSFVMCHFLNCAFKIILFCTSVKALYLFCHLNFMDKPQAYIAHCTNKKQQGGEIIRFDRLQEQLFCNLKYWFWSLYSEAFYPIWTLRNNLSQNGVFVLYFFWVIEQYFDSQKRAQKIDLQEQSGEIVLWPLQDWSWQQTVKLVC